MATTYPGKSILSTLSLAFIVFISFSISSCARKLTFGISPVVPAAKGSVKIKKSKNNYYTLDVKVVNLAPPKRLTPPRDVYVVWVESKRHAPRNIGTIKSSSGLFSNTLKGELKTEYPRKPTGVFITAEDNGHIQYPGTLVVLRTQ